MKCNLLYPLYFDKNRTAGVGDGDLLLHSRLLTHSSHFHLFTAGRRRRRNRAANRESLLSTKSEMASCSGPKDLDLGVTTYRATRSFPSFSAAPQPQTVAAVQPGPAAAAFAMRYQKGPPGEWPTTFSTCVLVWQSFPV